jgi:hypothetical protein
MSRYRTNAAPASAEIPNFQKLTAELASSPASPNLKFERADWALFRTVEGLQQKAGVAKNRLVRLVMKELADNALDEGGEVRVGKLPNGGYFVEDDGGGIEGTPDDIARLFSHNAQAVTERASRGEPQELGGDQRARNGRRGTGVRRHADRHHPQPPHRAAARV